MKSTLFPLLVLSTTTRFYAAASEDPKWQWGPETIDSCIEWYNHELGDEPCEYVRDYFNISPEDFAKTTEPPTTTITALPSSTSTSTLGPSPTVWNALGCYVDNTSTAILEERVSKQDGDADLTVAKCQDACYLAQYQFAGAKGGGECWCSGYVAGEWTRHQTDCNMLCTGNKSEICGGKGLVNVFEPEADDEWLNDDKDSEDEKEAVDGSEVETKGEKQAVDENEAKTKDENEVISAQTSSSGAMRNLALF